MLDTLLEPAAAQGPSPAAGLIQTVEGGILTKRSSRLAGIVRSKDPAADGMCLATYPLPFMSCSWLLVLA